MCAYIYIYIYIYIDCDWKNRHIKLILKKPIYISRWCLLNVCLDIETVNLMNAKELASSVNVIWTYKRQYHKRQYQSISQRFTDNFNLFSCQ